MTSINTADSVEIAFELMLNELSEKADDLNLEGAAHFRNSEYDKAKQKADIGTRLTVFRGKIELLMIEWRQNHAATFPETNVVEIEKIARTISSATRSSKSVLVVKFPDGSTIYERFAAETFVSCIKKIGIDRVKALNIPINRELLVSDRKSERYNSVQVDSLFIMTHSSTSQKKEILEQIAAKLGILISINVVPA